MGRASFQNGAAEPEDAVYRVHPLLLIYAAPIGGNRRLIAETRSDIPPVILHEPRVAWALSALPQRFTRAEALLTWEAGLTDAAVREELWDVLCCESLLVDAKLPDAAIRLYDAWAAFGWEEAAIYQESTRDYPFLKMDEPDAFAREHERMVGYVQQDRPPCIYQEFEALHSVELSPRLDRSASANAVLDAMTPAQRRGLPGLSLLCDLCFAERGTEGFGVQGRFLRKCVPSGGARHPTETFFAAFAGAPVPPGIYHYNVARHRLDCTREGEFLAELRHSTFDLFDKFSSAPIGLFVFTSLVERAMWRYREARSPRAVLVDVGHVLMAYRTVAYALGFKLYTYQKIRDSEVCDILGIERLRQLPLFVGTLV